MRSRIRSALLAAFALWGCASPEPVEPPPPEPRWPDAPVVEHVALPGTKATFDLILLPKAGETFLRPFAIGACEVTWKEFDACLQRRDRKKDGITTPSSATDYLQALEIPAESFGPSYPAINVRWHSAIVYCEWLSKATGAYYRLPTEPEWEYAARAGSPPESPVRAAEVAWFRGNSGEKTHEVGGKLANAFGLHDMSGNAWEYCLEPHDPPAPGPVLRGGCWSTPEKDLLFSKRKTVPSEWFEADPNRPRSVWWYTTAAESPGFRVVRVADASSRCARETFARRVEVRILDQREVKVNTDRMTEFFRRVQGEVRNRGERSLDEVEVSVFNLDPKGNPHLLDSGTSPPGRPTFSRCWPVLASSAYPAPRPPLRPGESRTFEVYVPQTFDTDEDVTESRFGASVTNLQFSPTR